MIIIIRVRIQLQDFLWPAIQCTKKAQANLKKYSDKTYKQYVTFAFSALKQIAQTNILNKNFTTINKHSSQMRHALFQILLAAHRATFQWKSLLANYTHIHVVFKCFYYRNKNVWTTAVI